MRFKTDREKHEYDSLYTNNTKLWNVLAMLDKFVGIEWGLSICITSIFRSEQEQEALYANVPENEHKPNSPHCFYKAADIRSTDFDSQQQKRMLQFLNAFSYKDGQGLPTAFVHEIAGNTWHFHIQCN